MTIQLENISEFIDEISRRLWEDIKLDIEEIDYETVVHGKSSLWDWRIQTKDEVVKELGIKFSDLASEHKDEYMIEEN